MYQVKAHCASWRFALICFDIFSEIEISTLELLLFIHNNRGNRMSYIN
jgi:hypothetical protein